MSTENTPKPPRLFFYQKKEEAEFRLLSLVEDTILGLLEIFERVIRTMGVILFQPRKLRDKVARPFRETELLGPYTFLAFTSFLTSLTLNAETLSIKSYSAEIIKHFNELSLVSVIKLALPMLLTKVFLSVILASLVSIRKGRAYRAITFKLFCYWFGMLFLLFGVSAVILAIAGPDTGSSLAFLLPFVLIYLFFFFYISFRLGGQALERFKVFKIRFFNGLLIGSSTIVLSFVSIMFIIYVGLREDEFIKWTMKDDESAKTYAHELSAWSSTADFTDPKQATMTVLVKNESPISTFILRQSEEHQLLLRYRNCEFLGDDCEFINSYSVPFSIESWEGDEPILKIAKGETKWVKIKTDLNSDGSFDQENRDYNMIEAINLDFGTVIPEKYEKVGGPTKTYEYAIKTFMNSVLWEGR